MESTLGGSILVPSVQELVKESPTKVPQRYLIDDRGVISDVNSLPPFPVIDLQKMLSGDLSELEKLDNASKEWGFFQLINHGVNNTLIENLKKEVQDFFNIPKEEKEKFWQKAGDTEGFGQSFVVSEEQKLAWGDVFTVVTLPVHLRKPHLFPCLPLPLRDTLHTYSAEMKSLAIKILLLMAKALGMDPAEISKLYDEGVQGMRFNYYPPCPEPDRVIGLNPHSDASALTILLQVNEIEGLQIKKDGKWYPVKPLPDAFVVNIGDMLEIATNGIYRSIEHRATVNSEKERLSIATFFSQGYEVNVEPAPSLVTPETPAVFRSLTTAEFLKGFFSRELKEKSFLDTLRIPNEKGNSNGTTH